MVDDPHRQLPIPDHVTFQLRSWTLERIAWAVMILLVLLGLAGVFASGPASDVRRTSADGVVTIEYARFARKTARSHFVIRVAAVSTPAAHVRLSRSFLEFYDIEVLEPQALQARAGRAGLELDFAASREADLIVDIAARAKRFGIATVNIDVEGHGGVSFKQLIYP